MTVLITALALELQLGNLEKGEARQNRPSQKKISALVINFRVYMTLWSAKAGKISPNVNKATETI